MTATEHWDLFDRDGKPLCRTIRRGERLHSGEYHLVVHIWVVSSDGKVLLQRRADTKKLMPGEWAATGGAAISGEDSFTAASRELYEELGIKSDETTLKKVLRLKRRNSLLDIWMIISDLPIESLKLQKSEVAEAKWVSLEDFKKMVKENKFHNYGREYFERLFEKISYYKGENQ